MQKHSGRRLVGVNVAAGIASGVDPESLEFAVHLLVEESSWPDAMVRIRTEPLGLECRSCGHEYERGELDLACPACGSLDVEVARGRDLRLESLEIEEDDGEANPA